MTQEIIRIRDFAPRERRTVDVLRTLADLIEADCLMDAAREDDDAAIQCAMTQARTASASLDRLTRGQK